MFHSDSFDSRSFDERSWFGLVVQAFVKRLRQTYITLATSYIFITQKPNEITVTKRGR